ncbi:MAG: MmgE/PrpD family protein [Bacillota bacterium]|nr:MmgE/PrpD family protein [Bacillota bacterium]
MDATCRFVRNFSAISYNDLSTNAIETTKKQLLDFIGVATAGSSKSGAKEITELYTDTGGAEQSSIIYRGNKLPVANAAQVNATMVHSLDYDDVHEAAIIHPGVVTISTLLAMAEYAGGLSGKDFIRINALGTDLICRLGLATRPGQNVHVFGWHLTTLYGYMTAAAVASMVMGLDEEKTINAIGIGYHQSAGNGQCVRDGALTKRMGPGFAVRGGITAALLADRGVTGAKNSLEGEAGIFKVYHQNSYSRDSLLSELGTRLEIENVSIKPYPCCRGTHPPIDAALTMVRNNNIKPGDIENILVSLGEATYGFLGSPLEVKARPRNIVDSQFSVPWCVATALAKGHVRVGDFTEEAIKDQEILATAAKIKTEPVPAFTDPGIEPARVEVITKNGKKFSEQVDFPTGTPARPLSYNQCEEKFRDCITHAEKPMPAGNADYLVKLIARLEEVSDVREVMALTKW